MAQSPLTVAKATAGRLLHGTAELPSTAVRHWRITVPLVVGAGLLIAYGDAPASGTIQSSSLETTSNTWSTRGLLFIEPAFLITAAGFEEHCLLCPGVADFAAETITSELYATVAVQVLKFGAGRERPGATMDGDGGFNESGSSFPSGHAIAAFTMASVLAHRYPQSKWADWGAYALATSVAGARFTAKEHFPSDLLIGSTLGELIGASAPRSLTAVH